MDDTLTSGHLTAEILVAYFDQTMTAEVMETVEVHLAACDACATLAQQAYALCAEWEERLARIHQEAAVQALIDTSLREAAATARPDIADWQQRLERWRMVLASLARDVGRVVAEAVSAPRLAPIRVRGGQTSSAALRLSVTLLSGPWVQHTRVVVDARAREVVVRVESLLQEQIPPLVLLAGEGQQTRVQVLERSHGGEGFLARFGELGPGDYIVDIEPQQAS